MCVVNVGEDLSLECLGFRLAPILTLPLTPGLFGSTPSFAIPVIAATGRDPDTPLHHPAIHSNTEILSSLAVWKLFSARRHPETPRGKCVTMQVMRPLRRRAAQSWWVVS